MDAIHSLYDSYGDGMNGANPEYQCGQDGDYTIYNGNTLEASLQNANFGESVSNDFKVEQPISDSWNCINESCLILVMAADNIIRQVSLLKHMSIFCKSFLELYK